MKKNKYIEKLIRKGIDRSNCIILAITQYVIIGGFQFSS
jgi:hypothetical protein